MSVTVTRHRGGGRDEDGKYIPGSDVPLEAFAVAPGAGHHLVQLGRDGEDIACTVYFTNNFTDIDLTNTDELTVDGERFQIIVNKWRSPWTDRGCLEVLCTRGQG
jgi:hypothetical protein